MIIFLGVQIIKLTFKSDNYQTLHFGLLDNFDRTINERGSKNLSDLNLKPFYILNKQKGGQRPFYPDKEIEKYVKFFFK